MNPIIQNNFILSIYLFELLSFTLILKYILYINKIYTNTLIQLYTYILIH